MGLLSDQRVAFEPRPGDTIEQVTELQSGITLIHTETILDFLGEELLLVLHGTVYGNDVSGPTCPIPQTRLHWQRKIMAGSWQRTTTPRWWNSPLPEPEFNRMLLLCYGDERAAMLRYAERQSEA